MSEIKITLVDELRDRFRRAIMKAESEASTKRQARNKAGSDLFLRHRSSIMDAADQGVGHYFIRLRAEEADEDVLCGLQAAALEEGIVLAVTRRDLDNSGRPRWEVKLSGWT